MELVKVLNPIDFWYVKSIHNECRELLPLDKDRRRIGFLRYIGLIIKYAFWTDSPIVYVLKNNFGEAVGWGEIAYDHYLNPWINGGISRRCRGQGYGRQLFQYLSEEWKSPVFCEILQENEIGQRLLCSLGFHPIGNRVEFNRNIVTMRKEWH